MVMRINPVRPDEPWPSRPVQTWVEQVSNGLVSLDARVTTTWRGLYDQVADQVASSSQPLDAATNYVAGEYYTCSVAGTFSTSLPELSGQTAGPGDQIISDGAQWQILKPSTGFLSSQVDDTAAGVITFTPAPKTPATPTVPDELTRKGYVDAATEAVQANLDDHIGELASGGPTDPHSAGAYTDTAVAAHDGLATAHGGHFEDGTIHYADAPADGQLYGRLNNAWSGAVEEAPNDGNYYVRRNLNWQVAPPPDLALMYGPVDSFTLNASPNVLQNYPNFGNAGSDPPFFSPSAGTITISHDGVYRITGSAVGSQGNDTKEEAMRLYLRIASAGGLNGDYLLDVFDIATDKTDQRAVNNVRTADLPAGAVLSLVMDATAGLGTFTFDSASFEVEQVL